MIETRESYQPLLRNRNSPPQSPGRRRKKKHVEAASYGTLKGEALLHADDSTPTNHGPPAFENNSTPQSVESSSGQYAEYQKPLATIPMVPQSNGIISPLSSGALPPAIPRRSRADSSGDRRATRSSWRAQVRCRRRTTPQAAAAARATAQSLPGRRGGPGRPNLPVDRARPRPTTMPTSPRSAGASAASP